jgi:serine/threonine protein kinase
VLSPGTRLGPYTIVAQIGAGGMGEVYRARDPRLARDIALKVLSHLADADARRRFEIEARAASALTHPNIVVVHDIGEEQGVAYIAMELVDGQPLRTLANGAPMAIDRLLVIAAQIADALRVAHAREIAHRDLKPENILIGANDVVKIVDFGLAKSAAGSQDQTVATTKAGLILGTPGYMSPEQARGLPSDTRSDQFALGALLYELATGYRAFYKGTPLETAAAAISHEPRPLSDLRPDLPAPLSWIIQRCLAKDPAQRYQSTAHLHRDLVAIRDRLASDVPAPPPAQGHETGDLFGRHTEAQRVMTLLQSADVHWVTLTGTGGVGKTTLARLVASRALGVTQTAVFNVA